MVSLKQVQPFATRRGTPLPGPLYVSFDLLAIDPGANTGWAAFTNGLAACGVGVPPVEQAVRVVLELPQVYPQHPVPPNDLITLAFLAGRYAGRSTREVFTVFPHQWKGNLPKDVCAARVRAKLLPDEQRVLAACDLPKTQMHNVMDAIGIGLFALGR